MSKSCSRAVRLYRQGFFQQVHISILFEPAVMPFIDLAFRLKPVGQVVSVFVTALMPKFMRSPGNLLFQTHIFVHMENWHDSFLSSGFFHSKNWHYGNVVKTRSNRS